VSVPELLWTQGKVFMVRKVPYLQSIGRHFTGRVLIRDGNLAWTNSQESSISGSSSTKHISEITSKSTREGSNLVGVFLFCYYGHMREHSAVLDKRTNDKRTNEEFILTYPTITSDGRVALINALNDPRTSHRIIISLEEIKKRIGTKSDPDRKIADGLMIRLVSLV